MSVSTDKDTDPNRRAPLGRHAHTFGQERRRAGERRTFVVIALTTVTMVVEIGAGLLYGSMALLADGLHMASHAAALSIAAVAYVYARRHAADTRYSFGTGKVNALAGFSGALLLALFSGGMALESVERLVSPVTIGFDHALAVAVVGLVVNAVSVLVLGHHDHSHDHVHEDHNLRSAYLHVVADALNLGGGHHGAVGGQVLRFGVVGSDHGRGGSPAGRTLVSRLAAGLEPRPVGSPGSKAHRRGGP